MKTSVVPRLEKAHFTTGKLCVAVFGPGHGEAIVVRLPDGRTGVVDGCRENNDPVARVVTELVAGRQLAFVCLTHPHLDHYRGIGSLIEKLAHQVEVVWTAGPSDRSLKATLKVAEAREDKVDVPDEQSTESLSRALKGFRKVLRDAPRGNPYRGWSFLRATRGAQHSFGAVDFHWVGPSGPDQTRSELHMMKVLRKRLKNENASAFDANVASLALALEWKQSRVLLAGDLVQGNGEFGGWSGLDSFLPNGSFAVVNVAHHASEGAHDPRIWGCLGSSGLALVTPYQNAANGQPPTPKDVLRLLQLGWRVVVTSTPAWLDHTTGAAAGLKIAPPNAVRRHVTPGTNTALRHQPFDTGDCESAALAVLDDTGTVEELVLAGNAREYIAA